VTVATPLRSNCATFVKSLAAADCGAIVSSGLTRVIDRALAESVVLCGLTAALVIAIARSSCPKMRWAYATGRSPVFLELSAP
jgi:hypothetical protein